MENYILHKADTRGAADHGWLNSKHSFSFGGYYDPERMNFGVLRVLNDDTVSGGMGFGKHPHDNMEIISIPLEGELVHKDSMGNEAVIKQGEIQVMSAGTGIYHSEQNHVHDKTVKFLQIWIIPNKRNVTPRYDQQEINLSVKNEFVQVLSPNKDDAGVWIYQDAYFSIGTFDKDTQLSYQLKNAEHGVYAFILEGNTVINGHELNKRDGLGIWGTDALTVDTKQGSRILLMEVPMQVN
ncbi:pirin family protein [Mucilaginibacter ginkgonis]|uniref:Pirin family protein n=1 Tax=Mucilaginibacter ginkgonis TaxID=2682091 RepID=A0A6I4I1A0_9SPHI|nr:pirin family protein [Mucilaginibacter ginkgonis]QQL51269.1 pirin family protein [Mucilaginibacter ginkgonis]